MTTIAFVVNGDQQSAIAHRADAFASRLDDRYDIRVVYRSRRKIASIIRFVKMLRRVKPEITYVFDMSYSGVLAALLHKWVAGNRLIIDTGDAIYELVRSTGNRSLPGRWLTRLLESLSLRGADLVVVRGTFHKKLLAERGVRAEVIQDGVETDMFAAPEADDLRKQLQLDQVVTIGLVGSSVWSEKLQMCYGWELVETLRLLKDQPVKGVMIGDGSGIQHLKERCKQYGIEDKLHFLGRIPYESLPPYLSLMDVCLSTQTNDVVGQVRTTGKLPLYLAAGRFVLASKVGEAALVLDDSMLVEYDGVKDVSYPRKLAERISALLSNSELANRPASNVAVAKAQFDYSVLSERMADLFEAMLKESR